MQWAPNCSCNMQPNVTVLFNLPICNISREPQPSATQQELHSLANLTVPCFAIVLPAWVLAVIIGLYGWFKISRLGPSVPGSISYADTFFMYAMMITSGFVVHSLFLVECGASPVTQVKVPSLCFCWLHFWSPTSTPVHSHLSTWPSQIHVSHPV